MKVNNLLTSFLIAMLASTGKSAPTQSKYYLGPIRQTWQGAKFYCESQGDRLAVIKTSADYFSAVTACPRAMVTGHWGCWIGLSDQTDFGPFPTQWTWVDGTKNTEWPKGSFVWESGQPDNGRKGNEGCVHLWEDHNNKFNDVDCKKEIFFICERMSAATTQPPQTTPPSGGGSNVPVHLAQSASVTVLPNTCFTQSSALKITNAGVLRKIVLTHIDGLIASRQSATRGYWGDGNGDKLMIVVARKTIHGLKEILYPRTGTQGFSGFLARENMYRMGSQTAQSLQLIFNGPPKGIIDGEELYICTADSVKNGVIGDQFPNIGSSDVLVSIYYQQPLAAAAVSQGANAANIARDVAIVATCALVFACVCGLVYVGTVRRRKRNEMMLTSTTDERAENPSYGAVIVN